MSQKNTPSFTRMYFAEYTISSRLGIVEYNHQTIYKIIQS